MVTMADTGLLAAPAAAAATSRHSAGKVQSPPGAYSSADETDSDADDRTNELDEHEHEHEHVAQQPVCLARSSGPAVVVNSAVNINNNNINNNGCGGGTSRNKRKNFQPRNISYVTETAEDGSGGDNGAGTGAATAGGRDSVAAVAAADATAAASAAALDLSGAYTGGSTVAKRPRVDDGSAPMDLTCTVPSSSSSSSSTSSLDNNKRALHAHHQQAQHAMMPHLLAAAAAAAASGGHPQQPEASDLKEYAQNTVRELLEIYGLNTDVADAITNNVPMVHFSTGK